MTNRRVFLKNSFAGGLVAALIPAPILSADAVDKALPKSPGYQRLEQLIGTHFMVIEEGVNITQLKLTDLLKISADTRLEQFHLYFTNTHLSSLKERNYHMHHAVLGDQHIFLQPLDQYSQGPHYRATFGLLIDPLLSASA